MKHFVLPFLLITLVASCNLTEDEDDPQTQENQETPQNQETSQDLLFDGWALTHFENTTTPYVFANADNILVSAIDNDDNGTLDGSMVRTPEGSFLLDFDEATGRPKQMTTSYGETLLFSFKEDGTKLDLAYIRDGNFQYFRDLDTSSPTSKTAFSDTNKAGDATDLIDVFILTGNILSTSLSGALCTAAIAATISSIGVAAPSLWTCAGFFTGLSSLAIDSGAVEADPEIFGGASLVALGSDLIACAGTGNPADCASALLGVVGELKSGIDDIQGENSAEIAAAQGALQSGFGAVKVTLTWTSGADLDLWVTEPNGNLIYYASPNSSTGGYLDFDDLDGPGPENIFWSENPPVGNYLVQVHNFSSNGAASSSYTVQVEINGSISVYQGSITEANQVNDITQFTIGASREVSAKALYSSKIMSPAVLKK